MLATIREDSSVNTAREPRPLAFSERTYLGYFVPSAFSLDCLFKHFPFNSSNN